MRSLTVIATCLLLVTTSLSAQSKAPESAVQWGAVPSFLPPGGMLALLSGDPNKPGMFTALLSMPNGYKISPYFLRSDEHVEVKQGVLLVGVGDKLDLKKTRAMAVGDTATAPAGAPHYLAAQGATIISVTTMGPYVITYVNPMDQPGRPFPFGY